MNSEKIKELIHKFKYGSENFKPTKWSAIFKMVGGAYLVYIAYDMFTMEGTPPMGLFLYRAIAVIFALGGIFFALKGYFENKLVMYGSPNAENSEDTGEDADEVAIDNAPEVREETENELQENVEEETAPEEKEEK